MDDNKEIVYKETFCGDSCVDDFLACLVRIEPALLNKLQSFPVFDKSKMTKSEIKALETATICHICEEPLDGDVVVDHCHITNKIRGFGHSQCNISLHDKKICIYAHNLG